MIGALLHLPEITPGDARDLSGDARAGIEQLAFLVGGVWVARTGSQTTEERCAWWLDESVIATDVTSRKEGEVVATARGMFAWDSAGQDLLSIAASDQGFFVYSRQTGGSEAPPTWVFQAHYRGAVEQERRITMSHPAADRLVIAQALRRDDGSWKSLGEATYERTPGAAG
ncbi:MAG: hypothetical protein R3234_07480 [Thermoanaerobaculia bacterium]|nr:hypothetical protein [Thermoanaerobaculia bacterium]